MKAFFFDRDGIVNVRIVDGYVRKIDEFEFCEDFFALFKAIKTSGYLAILVTNQQCIGKGIITEDTLESIHSYMQDKLLEQTGSNFDAIYFCPDLANSRSFRRKPEPGMFREAINKFGIDVLNSFTIGDSISDVEAGKQVGTTTILIGNYQSIPAADYIFNNLKETMKLVE